MKENLGARQSPAFRSIALGSVVSFLMLVSARAETFRVATYNVENYLDKATDTRPAKSAEGKAKVCENIVLLKPDVLALQEMGSFTAFEQLRACLSDKGLKYPYSSYVTGFDTNIHVAVLSRFPFLAEHPHTNDSFLLDGRRMHVSRGFAQVEIAVNTNYAFTLISAHLKSKRPIGIVDADEMRLEEAKLLRKKIDDVFALDPNAHLVVLGDFNDTPDAKSTKAIIGRGKHKLLDTRPFEKNGDEVTSSGRNHAPRSVAWTHFYSVQDTYSRIDYIMFSPTMAQAWVTNETFVLATPNWGVASDHRPILVTIDTDK